MRTLIITALICICSFATLSASVINNGNQSTSYVRQPARNTSTDIDAVYYNPAGLVKLMDGWHFAFNNQTILQEKKIVSDFVFLNDSTYIGKVNVPIFPNFYAVYKKDRLAFSFGFGPNGGGGSADYSRGLPSFETPFSVLPAMVSSLGIRTTQYSADIAFEGKSIFMGYQLNASYAFSDSFSAAVGLRHIQATNSYEGYIRDIMINPLFAANPTAQMISASSFFTMIGQSALAASLGDMEVKAEQTGSAWTPILSVFLSPADGLSISIKYEFNASLTLENKTSRDDTKTFPDGLKFRNDIPAIFSAGLQYALTPKWRAMLSFNYYFDKSTNWEGAEDLVDSNSYEFALGTEYDICQKLTLSVGYLRTQFGLSEEYLSDLGFELTSDTLGFGARYRLTEQLDVDLGVMLVSYSEESKTLSTMGISYLETYYKSSTVFSVGLGYRF